MNKHWGEPSDPRYMSRLGLIGFTPDKKSSGIWHLKNPKGGYVKECVKVGNYFNSMIGKPTAGHAWTTKGIYGDSIIYGSTPSRNSLPRIINKIKMLSKRTTDIDRDNLETGDIAAPLSVLVGTSNILSLKDSISATLLFLNERRTGNSFSNSSEENVESCPLQYRSGQKKMIYIEQVLRNKCI